ncbi:MAG: prolyl oligopeptidase family serine peptidase [Gemmatimonadales bacterium]
MALAKAVGRFSIAAALVTLGAGEALGQDVTIDKLLSAPFPSGLVASADGRVIAWVQNARGVRNVWVADAPAWQGRQLTAYAGDDGQELGSLRLSPDGATLLFVRGGAPNRRGEIPNPTSLPDMPEQAVWRVSTKGRAAPVKVGPGVAPLISPKGDLAIFSRRGQVLSFSLSRAGDPAPLFQVRGGAGDLAFSPDGSALVFSSSRGDHAFVGVFTIASRTIRWLDPSFDRDASPVWSPDGKRVAFVRIPAGFDPPLFAPMREFSPWSIRVADVASGGSREVWRAAEGRGSVPSGVTGDGLWWSADDRLVFPWERDGWKHLYSIPASGGQAVLLTPGEGEVEYVDLAPDGRAMLYNSNIGDIDRRHLWRVATAGGQPTALTSGTGIEWQPRAVVDWAADRHAPARRANSGPRGDSGRRLGAAARAGLDAGGLPSAALVEPTAIRFPAADGLSIPAQLFRPQGVRAGERRPAVLFFHGGSRRQMLLGWHYMDYYHTTYAINQYLASLGYVVLSVNYRSGVGYGLEFREALRYGATGASEFFDVQGAGLYLRSRPDVDSTRIGLYGGSYGGYLTAMGLSRASDLFAAGVDIHGVHDWNRGIQTFRPDYDTLDHPEFARMAFESSPMAWVEEWRSPVLLIHADDDRNVDFTQSVELIAALRARGVEVESLVFPDDVHGFLTHANWSAAARATAEFFERRLRGR